MAYDTKGMASTVSGTFISISYKCCRLTVCNADVRPYQWFEYVSTYQRGSVCPHTLALISRIHNQYLQTTVVFYGKLRKHSSRLNYVCAYLSVFVTQCRHIWLILFGRQVNIHGICAMWINSKIYPSHDDNYYFALHAPCVAAKVKSSVVTEYSSKLMQFTPHPSN